jgi:hypothetical protein
MSIADITLAKIQNNHGCASCNHRCDDPLLYSASLYWCSKSKCGLVHAEFMSNAQKCINWTLVKDKKKRDAFIDEAERQPGLPGVDE